MKAFYNRTPLNPNARANLDAGKIRPEGWLKELLARAALGVQTDMAARAESEPGALNALLLCALTLGDAKMKKQAEAIIEGILSSRNEDGSFAFGGQSDALTQMRVLNVVYLFFGATGSKEALKFIDAYLKYAYKTLPAKPLTGKACAQAADMMYIAEKLYNISARKYLLELCKLLKAQMLDWTNIFSTFPNVQPMSKSMSPKRLKEGMDGEKSDLEGEYHPFFASYYHQSLGENVANGLKAPGVVSLFKSGFKEQNGFKYGWEKLLKYHGTALGMFTCDEHLNGTNPSEGIMLKAVCETMRSLETLLDAGDFGNDLCDILEKLAYNALPAALDVRDGLSQRMQQTNQLNVSVGSHARYNTPDDANTFGDDYANGDYFAALSALSLFTAGLWQASADEGLSAVSYAPCTVSHVLDGAAVRLSVKTNYPFGDSVLISLNAARPVEFPMYLRIPFWAENPMIHLPNGEIMSVRAGETACIRQKWTSDSEIRLVLPRACRLSRLSRQSAAVEAGPLLMALPLKGKEETIKTADGFRQKSATLSGDWAYALAAEESMKLIDPEGEKVGYMPEEGTTKVLVKLNKTALWEKQGADAGAIPILPPCKRSESVASELVPYAVTKLRISQFPIAGMEDENA